MMPINAHADYTRTYDLPTTGSLYHRTGFVDTNGAISCTVNSYQGTQNLNNFTYAVDNINNYGNRFTIGTPIDLTNHASIDFRFARVVSGSVSSSDITACNVTFTFAGSDPDTGTVATEQRYNTNTFYSSDFTRSNSLPLIYTNSLFLNDFTPQGKCNSIQVDASTVGGDQLEWRLNFGQSGIDGQSAWLPIGFKMPIQTATFNEHSIQLRMRDPDNPEQFYDLQPSELSMCTVSYGYTANVYMDLPHTDYQELPTDSSYDEIQPPTVPSLDNLAGDSLAWADYLAMPLQMIGRVFAPALTYPDLFYLIAVVVFCCCVWAIVW